MTVDNTEHALLPHVEFLQCPVTLAWSKVGTVLADQINAFVDAILSSIAIEAVNKALSRGFPLPQMDGISFVNATAQLSDGYIQVLTDLATAPPMVAARALRGAELQ